jgi:hypothetical protein
VPDKRDFLAHVDRGVRSIEVFSRACTAPHNYPEQRVPHADSRVDLPCSGFVSRLRHRPMKCHFSVSRTLSQLRVLAIPTTRPQVRPNPSPSAPN